MSEMLLRRSALAGVYQAGRFGRTPDKSGITITERPGLAIVQIAAYRDTAEKTASAIEKTIGLAPAVENCRATVNHTTHVLWVGPQRWWIVEPEGRDFSGLRQTLGDDAAMTEHGHGRTVLRVNGPAVRDLLAKGASIDFHPTRFTAGWCRPTQLGHSACVIHCVDESPTVDLYVARSFAVSFWEWLTDAAGEFGYEIR